MPVAGLGRLAPRSGAWHGADFRAHAAAGLVAAAAGFGLSVPTPLLVGAHYDGPLHSPGADDNASGLVALLELARRWATDPPRRPVWLVAFDQ